ncbi:GNAT family N-acetyltransferase [Thioclava sp. FR2]|uniref:GNAT family N-acetyltransferase n=1 Tax=Thioclava sp. FR2 TaxID=3445780 RepID=UPI003EB962E5
MSTDEIRKEVSGAKARYLISRGEAVAELTLSIATPQLEIADHTSVPDAWRGEGGGAVLVARLVSDARMQGFKILPLCPFVNAQRRKHPEWADVFQV